MLEAHPAKFLESNQILLSKESFLISLQEIKPHLKPEIEPASDRDPIGLRRSNRVSRR